MAKLAAIAIAHQSPARQWVQEIMQIAASFEPFRVPGTCNHGRVTCVAVRIREQAGAALRVGQTEAYIWKRGEERSRWKTHA